MPKRIEVDKERLIELRDLGRTLNEIGIELNVKPHIISARVKEWGLQKNSKIVIDKAKLVKLRNLNYTVQQIANEFNVKHHVIETRIKDFGLQTGKYIDINSEELEVLIKKGYTNTQIRDEFRVRLNKPSMSIDVIKRAKKEFKLSGKIKLDFYLKDAEVMWKSKDSTIQDIANTYNTCAQTIKDRAKKNNWGDQAHISPTIESNITQDYIKKILNYDQYTGIFTWKERRSYQTLKDTIANKLSSSTGYSRITINGSRYQAHNIAILYIDGYYPPNTQKEVDHIDHNRANNAYVNLEIKTHSENQKNKSLSINNTSGFNGVNLLPSGKYCVRAQLNNTMLHIGTYNTIEEAIDARKQWDKENGFHENHGKSNEQDYYTGSRREVIKQQTPIDEDMQFLNLILDACPKGYENDHIKPLSKGGLHTAVNIQYLTKKENRSKGHKYPYECKTTIMPEDII